jgi:hypothetical protein
LRHFGFFFTSLRLRSWSSPVLPSSSVWRQHFSLCRRLVRHLGFFLTSLRLRSWSSPVSLSGELRLASTFQPLLPLPAALRLLLQQPTVAFLVVACPALELGLASTFQPLLPLCEALRLLLHQPAAAFLVAACPALELGLASTFQPLLPLLRHFGFFFTSLRLRSWSSPVSLSSSVWRRHLSLCCRCVRHLGFFFISLRLCSWSSPASLSCELVFGVDVSASAAATARGISGFILHQLAVERSSPVSFSDEHL